MPGVLIGALVTIALFMAATIFQMGHHMGHHSARLEALEAWRASIRLDMHEISRQLGVVGEELKRLGTLIEERTHRHRFKDEIT
jgi:hypothetical protein